MFPLKSGGQRRLTQIVADRCRLSYDFMGTRLYKEGQRVWLKTKVYKTGENRKYAPRRSGPWIILKKLPNRVNFTIQNSNQEKKFVHHDRLLPVIEPDPDLRIRDAPSLSAEEASHCDLVPENDFQTDYSSESDSTSEQEDSDLVSGHEDSSDSSADSEPEAELVRNYPRHERRTKQFPGVIPWDSLPL